MRHSHNDAAAELREGLDIIKSLNEYIEAKEAEIAGLNAVLRLRTARRDIEQTRLVIRALRFYLAQLERR